MTAPCATGTEAEMAGERLKYSHAPTTIPATAVTITEIKLNVFLVNLRLLLSVISHFGTNIPSTVNTKNSANTN